MSLLTGWTGKSGYRGPDNKVKQQLPASRTIYTLVKIGDLWIWHKEVIDTERFSITGMDETTAAACQAAMVTAYTKTKTIPTVVSGEIVNSTVSQCVADIRAVRTSDNLMWQVDVDVNEVTHSFSLTAS